jgi:pre-mRNA-splicing helicase BRR2
MDQHRSASILPWQPLLNEVTHCHPSFARTPAGDSVTLIVDLERDNMAGSELSPVHAPRFPGVRDEGWWLVVGQPKANKLLGIKRVSFGKSQRVKLAFDAPAEIGTAKLSLFFMCDSWLGCDQEYEVELQVTEAAEGSGTEEMSE